MGWEHQILRPVSTAGETNEFYSFATDQGLTPSRILQRPGPKHSPHTQEQNSVETQNTTFSEFVSYELLFFRNCFDDGDMVSAKRKSSASEMPRPVASLSTTSMDGFLVPRSMSVKYVRCTRARCASSSCVRSCRSRKCLTASPSLTSICLRPLRTPKIFRKIHRLSTDDK